MAKKSRRARSQAAARAGRQAVNAPQTPPSAAAPTVQPARVGTVPVASPRGATAVNFAAEYAYVTSDLITTGVIAVVMIAALVVLSFILR
jgi:hypothetical protein